MCVWRETASEGCETRETRDLHCHVRFCLGLLCERLSLVAVFVTRLRVSKFYVVAELVCSRHSWFLSGLTQLCALRVCLVPGK